MLEPVDDGAAGADADDETAREVGAEQAPRPGLGQQHDHSGQEGGIERGLEGEDEQLDIEAHRITGGACRSRLVVEARFGRAELRVWGPATPDLCGVEPGSRASSRAREVLAPWRGGELRRARVGVEVVDVPLPTASDGAEKVEVAIGHDGRERWRSRIDQRSAPSASVASSEEASAGGVSDGVAPGPRHCGG